MYDADRFFVPNALNRYTLSQRDNLVANADGSVDIYLQADSPGKASTKRRIGCPLQKRNSASCCVCTGRRRGRSRSLTAPGNRRRFGVR